MRFVIPILLTLSLIGLSTSGSLAQRPPGLECPATDVWVSENTVTDGDKVTFHANLTGGNVDRNLLRYFWSIDRGKIVGGQGTAVIVVDTTGTGPAGSITATMDIEPYRDCCWVTFETVFVRRNGPLTKADVFWDWFRTNASELYYNESSENAILDKLRFELQKADPNLTFEIGPKQNDKRDFTLNHSNNKTGQKILKDFTARAPEISSFNIRIANLN